MDERAAKLAAARRKLKHHQEKKVRTECSKLSNHNLLMDGEELQPILKNEDSSQLKNEDSDNVPTTCTEFKENGINVTEILISEKTKLETQVKELEIQLMQVQNNYTLAVDNQNTYIQTVSRMEMEIETIKNNYKTIKEESLTQKKLISDLQNKNMTLTDDNNNLLEQLDFTKTVLTSKENENFHLKNQICHLENQLDTCQLQIKQLTNDPNVNVCQKVSDDKALNSELNDKISNLQGQLTALQKERDNLSSHYEHYVSELNAQLKAFGAKNNSLIQELNQLYNRENSLVDQIGELEKRLQSYQTTVNIKENKNSEELQEKLNNIEAKYQQLNSVYIELQKKYIDSEEKIKTLSENNETECDKNNICLSKLNADITSDKIAAQRATEQNKKLKADLEELEFAFVKMSKDKLDLTEKLTHEKQLSKELMLKLADIEDNSKSLHNKIMAKDHEMIRLQNSFRLLEKDYKEVLSKCEQVKEKEHNHTHYERTDTNSNQEMLPHVFNGANEENSTDDIEEGVEIIENNNEELRLSIAKEDAMLKLQERFLNIMDEVANLSDEKHRLEHIILQLQNETDTVCEYITLYQQQRSLLKKRDEERSEQIKMFQIESNKLKSHLDELNKLLLRFANDEDLVRYLQDETRRNDLAKVIELLSNLKNSSLITSHHKSLDFKNFYPCSCCTGQIIDI